MNAITTPFDFASTASEVVSGIDLTGRRAVVTGASSGIGTETARALAATGATVTLAVRDVTAGERAAKDITQSTGNQDVQAVHLDLTDPASITAFTAAWQGPLHILVNNAGVMPARSSTRSRAGSGSSPPTTWAISPSPPACTTRWPLTATPASWW